MKKLSVTSSANWQAFVAQCPPAMHGWSVRSAARFAGRVFVSFAREDTWQLAKQFGGFQTVPAPWVSIKRLPQAVFTAFGAAQADEDTVGDYLERLLGRDIFRD